MTRITPLGLANHDTLRAIHAGAPDSNAELAAQLGRDASNFSKSLKAMEGAGLIAFGQRGLTPEGEAMLAALDRAEDVTGGAATAGVTELLHHDIAPDPLNPRKDFDEDELDELADSIENTGGILQNLVVKPAQPVEGFPTPMHLIVAGERRWRAVGRLIAAGRVPPTFPLPVRIRAVADDREHEVLALTENEIRAALKPMEQARAYARLRDLHGMPTDQIAAKIGKSQRYVQQRLSLLNLPEIKQVELAAGKISFDEARKYVNSMPKLLTLTPRQWLIAIEVYAKQVRDPRPKAYEHSPTSVLCRLSIEDDADVSVLVGSPNQLLAHVNTVWECDGDSFTRSTGSPSWASTQLKLRFGAYEASDGLDAALTDAREAAGLWPTLPVGVYATDWLNGPFTRTPAQDAEFAAKKAEREERIARQSAEREAQDAVRAAKQEAERAMLERDTGEPGQALLAQVRALELEAPGLDHIAFTAQFAKILEGYGVAGPYVLAPNSDQPQFPRVVDGQGRDTTGAGAALEARKRLTAIALNYTAGLSPYSGPELPPVATAHGLVVTKADFCAWIADHLHDDSIELDDEEYDAAQAEARELASAGLDAYLRAEILMFGAEGMAWDHSHAQAVAVYIRVNELDVELGFSEAHPKQVDLEEAIDAAVDLDDSELEEPVADSDDAETPAFLRRLAGGSAAPAREPEEA